MAVTRFQQRRDVASDWTTVNPVLAAGEIGVETDTKRLKLGDGVSRWASLPYVGELTDEQLSSVLTPEVLEEKLPTRLGEAALTATIGEAVAPKYTKPPAGVPSGDLAQPVRDSLARADASDVTEIVVSPTSLVTTLGTPGGLGQVQGVPAFGYNATSTDDRASCLVNLPPSWTAYDVLIRYVSLTASQTGDGRFRIEETFYGVGDTLAGMTAVSAALTPIPVAGLGTVYESRIVTGRAAVAGKRLALGLVRTNTNVADTFAGTVGVTALIIRRAA